MSSQHNLAVRGRFVEDLLARHDTYGTLAIFHDWLIDNGKIEEEDSRLDLLKGLIHLDDRWSSLEGSRWSLPSWQENFKELILFGSVTRNDLQIFGREPMDGQCWFTWTSMWDPEDRSEVPPDILQYLHGWIIGGSSTRLYADPPVGYDYHTQDPIKDLSLACWDWGCDQLRHLFGVPKKLVTRVLEDNTIGTRTEYRQ